MKKLFTRLITAALIVVSSACTPAYAADMTNYLENKLIDAMFRGVAFTMPTVLAVALHTGACSDSSAGTEVSTSGTAYNRVTLNPSTTNWSATDSSSSTANPSAGNTGTTYNRSAVSFPTATGSGYGTVTHFSIWDSATVGAGNMLFCKALSGGSQAVAAGSTPSFAAGALSVQIDN
jgi:hypothetical protein